VLFPGKYSILETPAAGYTTTYENCSGVSVLAGSSTVCTITNNDIAPAVTEPQVVNGPTGGGNIVGGGQVLGASTDDGNSCSVLLTDYMRYGQKNNSVQVTKLQTFLNSQNLGITLVVNGIFDRATENAVKAFQLKYAEEILAPWVKAGKIKNKVATGYVYKTTLRWINHLNCSKNPLPPISL
jgi:peptidoglycan hydrolase-like protein with peptidoglycan-binding domain